VVNISSKSKLNELAYDYSQEPAEDHYQESKVRGSNTVKRDITGQGLNVKQSNKSGGNNRSGGGGGGVKNEAQECELSLNQAINMIIGANVCIDTCVAEKRIDVMLPMMIESLEVGNEAVFFPINKNFKMGELLEKLTAKGEEFLTSKTIGIMEDIATTLNRNSMLMKRKRFFI
jgi:hypothetical protein